MHLRIVGMLENPECSGTERNGTEPEVIVPNMDVDTGYALAHLASCTSHEDGTYVVCLLVHPEKGPWGRLICLYVVCLLVHPEKGPRGRLVLLSLCSLSPGTGVPGEGLFVYMLPVSWCS